MAIAIRFKRFILFSSIKEKTGRTQKDTILNKVNNPIL